MSEPRFPKPKVGDKVLFVHERRGSKSPRLVEEEVVRVGRLYFYTREKLDREWSEHKLKLETWREGGGWAGGSRRAFPSRQEYRDELEAEELRGPLADRVSRYGLSRLSLDQLRRIEAVLDEVGL